MQAFPAAPTLTQCCCILQDNPRAAYGAWRELHGKQKVRMCGCRHASGGGCRRGHLPTPTHLCSLRCLASLCCVRTPQASEDRFSVFEANAAFIRKHNAEHASHKVVACAAPAAPYVCCPICLLL
jgi:hypothetical protein